MKEEEIDKVLDKLDSHFEKFLIKIKDTEDKKTYDEVFDKRTLIAINTMMSRGWLETVEYPISTGKEANVFKCSAARGFLAMKIFRIHTSTVKRFADYIQGDPRFKAPLRSKTQLIFTWTRKEYQNLSVLRRAGVRVPEPFHYFRNMLLMEYLGEEDRAAPRLKEVNFTVSEGERIYKDVVEMMKRTLTKARLVHADLSEYNILFHLERPWFIDTAQAVRLEHPEALSYLKRDCRNITTFFKKRGVSVDGSDLEEKMVSAFKEALI